MFIRSRANTPFTRKRRSGRKSAARLRPSILCLEDRRLLSLGTTSLVEGQFAGSDSVVVAVSGAWTAASNASWLSTSSSGTGNGVATFSFNPDPFGTRTGTLTIAGSTLTVTQTGGSYFPADPLTTLVATGLSASVPWRWMALATSSSPTQVTMRSRSGTRRPGKSPPSSLRG